MMSAVSSLRKSSIILSIIAITWSKGPPNFKAAAILATCLLWRLVANFWSCLYAFSRFSLAFAPVTDTEETCTKVVNDELKTFRAPFVVKMPIASATPTSSSERRRERSDHSAASARAFFTVSSRKASAAASVSSSAFFVASVSALDSFFVAVDDSSANFVVSSVPSSFILVADSSLYALTAAASSSIALPMDAVKASYMPFKMP
mmetsp:Transcript_8659/g.14880  ORF Transcript_8659/g.14880 Transcript_8659/m.14880 type:complete len:205 (-) Transcript_8659:832-1446(-)